LARAALEKERELIASNKEALKKALEDAKGALGRAYARVLEEKCCLCDLSKSNEWNYNPKISFDDIVFMAHDGKPK
jgi:hypothetical protein